MAGVKRRRAENPNQRTPWDRKYYERNRDKFRNWDEQRRARESGAERVEKIDREYIIARDGGTCHLCGKKPLRHLIELDHLVPLSKGGNHTADNLRVSCRRCNRVRNDGRLPAQLLLVG